MTEEELFEKLKPHLTEATDARSLKFLSETGGIVSVNGKVSGLDALSLVLAANGQTFGPYLLTSAAARGLCRLLIKLGFDM